MGGIFVLVGILTKEEGIILDILTIAHTLKDETISHRRTLHTHPEVGLDMPFACEYVERQLITFGITPRRCGKGIVAEIGSGNKTLLLRADMDALPMREQSGEPFRSQTEFAHTCGHDMHTAMLLTAAKILKEREPELNHKVRFMFQPGEEILEGAKNMCDCGVLDGVDAALAFHVAAGKTPPNSFFYNPNTALMNSSDGFLVTVHGKGGHSAYPNLAVDPLAILVKIYDMFNSLPRLYAPPEAGCTLTVTTISSGSAYNVIPDTATLQGSLRTDNEAVRYAIRNKMCAISEEIPKIFGGTGDIEFFASVPPLVCDNALTLQTAEILNALGMSGFSGMQASASEDFAVIAERVPSAFVYLSAGFADECGDYTAHNPKVRFNEDVLPLGAAAYAECALSLKI